MQINLRGNFTITAKKLISCNTKDTSHILEENLMIRKVKVGSVFGTPQRTSYEYMKLLNNNTS